MYNTRQVDVTVWKNRVWCGFVYKNGKISNLIWINRQIVVLTNIISNWALKVVLVPSQISGHTSVCNFNFVSSCIWPGKGLIFWIVCGRCVDFYTAVISIIFKDSKTNPVSTLSLSSTTLHSYINSTDWIASSAIIISCIFTSRILW